MIINGTSGNDKLLGTSRDDSLYGLLGDDELHGGDGNDLLEGGAGNDALDGGGNSNGKFGGDTASYAKATDVVIVDLFAGTATGGAGDDTLTNVENIIGSAFSDTLIGDFNSNELYGGKGDRKSVV